MNMDRLIGIGGLVLGVLLFSLAGDGETYLFPRFIAIVIAILGLAILVSNLSRRFNSRTIADKSRIDWRRIMPVIVLFVVYPWAIEVIGFYSTGFAAFLGIVWIYAPEPASAGVAARRIAISVTFIAAVFTLFSLLLSVQTPRGILL